MVVKQMETVKEIVEDKVEAILEDKTEEIQEKAQEVAKKVDETAEKVGDAAELVIRKVEGAFVDRVGRMTFVDESVVSKAVDVVDAALVGVGVSCGCLGWKFSVEKIARKQKA